MKSQNGRYTAKFGARLTSQFKLPYRVYYDHGNVALPNVGKVKGFYGATVTNRNRLADVDVLIACQHEALLLIEIEEAENPEPKKLLGDVLPLLMCNRLAFGRGKNQTIFEITEQTQLIVASIVPSKGQKRQKVMEVIVPRLHQFRAPAGGIQTANVRFLFGETMDNMIAALEDEVLTAVNGR